MAADNSIKNIFRSYIGKHFSKTGQAAFGRWLRTETDCQSKEELLRQFWLDTEVKATDETQNDWNRLKHLMDKSSHKINLYWLKYAAVAALFLISVVGTYCLAVRITLQKPVEMVELFVPNGETKEFTLPDGSNVWVKAGSTVVYPEDFEKMDTRSVYLTGVASFSVTKNKEKPFIVKTAAMDVQALGTVFTVEAYAEDKFTTATLEEGKVKVSLKGKKSTSHILEPGDQLAYSDFNGLVIQKKVDVDAYKKLRKGYLIFEDVDFQTIITTLEKKYRVAFQYNSTRYGKDLYNMKFAPDETIEDVMEVIYQLVGVKYKIRENQIIIQ